MVQGGEDFFKDKNDDYSSSSKGSFRNMPPDRSPMIEKIYNEVLGRKPSSRELSYYKYSAMSEDEIRIKLLQSDEHTSTLEDAKRLKGVEDELRNSQLNEKRLIQRIDDLGKQIDEGQILLDEKSSIISQLREQLQNPYNLPSQTQKYEEGFDVYRTVKRPVSYTAERKSFADIVRDFFNILLK